MGQRSEPALCAASGFVSRENLLALVEGAHLFAAHMASGGGECPPFIAYRKGDGQHVLMVIESYADLNLKEKVLAHVRTVMRSQKATDYVIGFEAWMSKVDAKVGPLCAPRDDPNRQEIVSLVGSDNKGLAIGWSAQIETVSGQRVVKSFMENKGWEIQGLALNLLYDRHAN